jgi:predicted helicase
MGDLKSYLAEVKREFGTGVSTEHTHRGALKALVESFSPDIVAINEPKRVECGAPDYVVKRGDLSIGYIEAKDVGRSLDEAERSEQLDRYLRSLENLILTDYLEFRWYHRGELRERARLAKLTRDGKIVSDKKGEVDLVRLFESFLDQSPVPITSSKELSERLARLAREIQRAVVKAFEQDLASTELRNLRRAFAEVLIPDLDLSEKTAEFADMYSQTIVYGLFAARCNHLGPEPFRRLGAARSIPRTNPFLRQLFETITGTALDDEPYVDYVEDVVTILDHTDLDSVLADFGKRTKQEDPVVHFYETFLSAYDPKLRERRGVYYTPEPVVSFIVRSVDSILKSHFGLGGGLMDSSTVDYEEEAPILDRYGKPDPSKLPERVKKTSPKVLILDPACGTGTFLYAVIDHIRQDFMAHGNAGYWSAYVRDHLLPRIFGFELLMAPYAVAHFKLGMMLAGQDLPEAERGDWIYDFKSDERLGVYLTNTLEEAENPWKNLWGYEAIGREAQSASVVKRDKPIMVVIGNPPYSGISSNKGEWIKDLLRGKLPENQNAPSYYEVDGKPLGEKKLWLQDDYVKFLRWGQWRVEQTGIGILAFVTNHGYLDNPTFRGMRQALMNSFNEIYVLDLHGSAKKKELPPNGIKDDNVFDIQQGVAIGIFIKNPDNNSPARVYHADLWGSRDQKYRWLIHQSIENSGWSNLTPVSPFYLFVPRDDKKRDEYELFSQITDIIPVNITGIVTARDHFVFDFDEDSLLKRIKDFADHHQSDQEIRERYFKGKGSSLYPDGDTRGWKLPEARKKVLSDAESNARIVPCLYRPFDVRPLYYTDWMVDWPRSEIMRHMLVGRNVGISTTRSTEIGRGWEHIFCTSHITQHHTVSLKEVNYLFPLYLYPSPAENSSRQKSLASADWPPGKDGRVPNLSPEFVADFAGKLGLSFVPDGRGDREATFGPEDVFDYIYAVFHSPSYRERYAEFLKIDFPRVPLTSDREKFRLLVKLGGELVALHLLESPLLDETVTRYPVVGDNRVEKGHPKYFAPGEVEPGSKAVDGAVLEVGRVYINRSQYFAGVPPEVWEFQVGGYQVCDKWLKDRRGRQLSYDDLTHYQKVVVALKETIRLMEEVDSAVGAWPLE